MTATVEDQLEQLLQRLDRKILVRWVDEMRLGQPAYDYLSSALSRESLSKNQRANALVALYRLRQYGKDEDLLSVLVGHATHVDMRVRGQAISLLVGLMREHNFRPPYVTDQSVKAIKSGLSMGLHQNSERVARGFLDMAERSGTPH